MEVMDDVEVINELEKNREVHYGVIFDGLDKKEVLWRLTKFHKNNGIATNKQYLVDGYYFDIFIGAALFAMVDGLLTVDFISTETRNHE